MENQLKSEETKAKKKFFKIKAQFTKKGYKPKWFNCLVFWHNSQEAEKIAKQHFDEFLQTYGKDFSYKIIDCKVEELLFIATEPKHSFLLDTEK